MIDLHYQLSRSLAHSDIDVITQNCCLQIPESDDGIWDIKFPDVKQWTDNTLVIMHCQDFVNVKNNVCRELQIIEEHFEDRCKQVVVIVWNLNLETVYNGDLNLVYFPIHTYEILANLLNIDEPWVHKFIGDRKYRFQCLNGVAKTHREITFNLLQEFENGITSLHPEKPIPEFTYEQHLRVQNHENFLKLLPLYNNCDINVVTETLYYTTHGIITEKTLFAWLAKQVPIIIGHQGIVQQARDLGFDTFDDVVDNSYDNEPDHCRVKCAIESNRDLLINGIDREELKYRLLANQNHALSWPARMIVNYEAQLKSIYREITGT